MRLRQPSRCAQVYGLSGPVARYIGRNAPILHRFANEDVTLGAWLVGLEVTHVDERRLCCDSAERCMAQVGWVLCPMRLYICHRHVMSMLVGSCPAQPRPWSVGTLPSILCCSRHRPRLPIEAAEEGCMACTLFDLQDAV